MNLNIISPKIASGLQKKNCWVKKLSDCNCDYKILKNTIFLQPPKMNVSDCKKLFRKNEKTVA
jgi:hypothetical protein